MEKVIIYLNGFEPKDNAIRQYCKDNNLKIVKEIKPNLKEPEYKWNSGIYKLFKCIRKLNKKGMVGQVIAYSLDDFFWCTQDQLAIILTIFNLGANTFTIKEGDLIDSNVTKFSITPKKSILKNLKKYWVEENIEY